MFNDDPLFNPLADVFTEAYDQAAHGKGKERHGNDKSFLEQPMFTIAEACPGFCFGQAIKKLMEAQNTGSEKDVLGAMVYAASGLIDMRKRKEALNEKRIPFPEIASS